MHIRTICIALVIAFSIGSSAFAQSAPSPELRVMDFTNAGSTSTCIGNPVTPLCAVETYEACRIRTEWPLCAAVDFEPGELRNYLVVGYARLKYVRYEILGRQVITAENIPDWAGGEASTAWKPDDVAVRLWFQGCPPVEKCVIESQEDPNREFGEGCRTFEFCRKYPSPFTYIVRSVGERWILVTEFDERDRPELQGIFWNRK